MHRRRAGSGYQLGHAVTVMFAGIRTTSDPQQPADKMQSETADFAAGAAT